jgi:hypothetical protein
MNEFNLIKSISDIEDNIISNDFCKLIIDKSQPEFTELEFFIYKKSSKNNNYLYFDNNIENTEDLERKNGEFRYLNSKYTNEKLFHDIKNYKVDYDYKEDKELNNYNKSFENLLIFDIPESIVSVASTASVASAASVASTASVASAAPIFSQEGLILHGACERLQDIQNNKIKIDEGVNDRGLLKKFQYIQNVNSLSMEDPKNLFDAKDPKNLFDAEDPKNLFDAEDPKNLFDSKDPKNLFDAEDQKNLLVSSISSKLNENNENLLNLDQENKKFNYIYNTNDITDLFMKINKSVIIIQIIENKITFIEKKGFQSRNQSVIDLLIQTSKYYKLPDIQFIIFTDDFIDQKNIIQDYLFTFCRNNLYKNILFPNFNFNHWKEAKIDYYDQEYNFFINNKIDWNKKENIVFWSGSNTNIIRKKVYNGSYVYNNLYNNNKYKYIINLANNYNDFNKKNKFYSIKDHCNFKYLLNMNGYSYGGRLNYLFLTGSCIIILKNNNKEDQWEEFFYKYFIPNIDYIEVLYNDNDAEIEIINNINNMLSSYNCEEIANN